MQYSSGPRRHAGECANRVGNFARGIQGVLDGYVPSVDQAAEICDALGLEFYVGPARGDERLAAPFVGKAPCGNRSESRPEPSDFEKSVRELASAVLAAGGNPFPPDLRDETLTVLVATHGAPPGTRPGNVVEFAAAAAAWGSTVSRP